jgi:NosR/NirI family transcriptional regulator, nitrous oxide reductase regulator
MSIPSVKPKRSGRLHAGLLHLYRWGLLAVIVLLVRQQHEWHETQRRGRQGPAIPAERAVKFFPAGAKLAEWDPRHGGQTVSDADGWPLGYVVQTSPASDAIIGFSGPTNTLIAFDAAHRILGLDILRCGDTPEHLQAVLRSGRFLTAYNGLTWEQARARQTVDAVSGATLTSLAIRQGIAARLGGAPHSFRFPEPLRVDDARRFFPEAAQLVPSKRNAGVLEVVNAQGQTVGQIAHTSPVADDLIGFQGPTDTLIALDGQGRVAGLSIRKTYETPDYMPFITEDRHFLRSFHGRTLDELAELDLAAAGVEGVSGATMTSLTMAQGLVSAAKQLRRTPPEPPRGRIRVTARDAGTAAIVVLAALLGFSPLRGRRLVRIAFQILVIAYLGLINGDMLSQSLLVGWAQTGLPWRSAPGLVLLVAAALAVPLLTRRQVYCHHVCPHGALQQLVRHKLPWPWRLGRWLTAGLKLIPLLLLVWVVVVAVRCWPFSLNSIEPFDAYLFRVAGWGTIAVAGVGLAVSLFVPLAYCRFGCPTGTLLNYLRWHGPADRFTRSDLVPLALAALAWWL